MSTFLPVLLVWLQQYGYAALWLLIFVAAVGLPLPIRPILLAAGAFAALGIFNIVLLGIIAISAAACGDTTGYFIGRLWGSKALHWLEQPRWYKLISPQAVARSHIHFNRHGGGAIFLSHFPFSALGAVIDLLAGAELYPYRRFLIFDISGQTLGAIVPLALGYIFSTSWRAMGDVLSAFSGFVLVLLLAILLTIRLCKMLPLTSPQKPSPPFCSPPQEANDEWMAGNLRPPR